MFLKLKAIILLLFIFLHANIAISQEQSFDEWIISYKKFAIKEGVSLNTVERAFTNVRFIEKVIKYDRAQPEFIEDTNTYVNKRATNQRAQKAKKLLKNNIDLFKKVEDNFNVEKEVLLALWGIETNFGKHVGKMDIISSLATLSYDKRRRDFFSMQLLTLLKLIDEKLINQDTLYGSWAGAYGNFQFMPTTISRYAIDFDNNNKIELKTSLEDSLASAANYINKIGWKKSTHCYVNITVPNNINKKYINYSAKKIKNKLSIKQWKKKGIKIINEQNINNNTKAALIIPDGDFNPPAFLVFSNYEKILKWNRSLRFGISVCTLAEMIKS